MFASLTKREKLLTLTAVTASLLFGLDTFVLAPYRQGIATRLEESASLADRRMALAPYADDRLITSLEEEAERIERQLGRPVASAPVEPTERFIPKLVEPTEGSSLRLVGLTRTGDATTESFSLSLLADHAGTIRFLRRLDHTGVHVTQLALHRTNGDSAPLAMAVTLEKRGR